MASHLVIVILSQLDHVPQLMEAWEQAGVPGITIMDSIGGFRARRWLERSGLPFSAALRNLFQAEEVRGRVLLAAIDDEAVLERAIAEAERVVGGFDRPHGGVLLVIPIQAAYGIRKHVPTPSEEKPPLLAPTGPRTITRRTPISEVLNRLKLTPVIIHEDDTLEEAARAMLQQPNVQCACVVNDENRLVGILPLTTIADDVFLHIVPEEFLSHVTDLDGVADFMQRSQARQVRAAMQPPIWVKPDDTVQDAFKKMHESGLNGLPVVDDNYRIIGYVNLLELLDVWLSAEGAEEEKKVDHQERGQEQGT